MPGTPPRGLPSGGVLLAFGATPFAAGIASNAAGLGEPGAPRLLCPFAEATGLPCPFCGASRAFRLVTAGDSAFVHYNPFWVAFAAILVIAGTALLIRQRRRGGPPPRTGQPGWAPSIPSAFGVLGLLMLGGWCVAVANRDAIVA